jgi:hypothetical protein
MLSLIFVKARTRCRKVLEHFFRLQSAEVLESVVECWNTEKQVGPNSNSHEAQRSRFMQAPSSSIVPAFELVDALAASAHNVVHMICESISCRVAGLPDRNRKQVINPNLYVPIRLLHIFLIEELGRTAYCSDSWRAISVNLKDHLPSRFGIASCNWQKTS